MKYLESWKDIFTSKSSDIVDKLGKIIFNFLELNFFNDRMVQGLHKKFFYKRSKNVSSIFYLASPMIGFYFNKNTKLLIVEFIYENEEVNDIVNFTFSKVEKFAVKKKNKKQPWPSIDLWFKLEDIPIIIEELKNEFDIYIAANKYNL